jgi:hypothetical protein
LQNALKHALQEHVGLLKARIGVFESFAQQRLRSGILFDHITEAEFVEELESMADAPRDQGMRGWVGFVMLVVFSLLSAPSVFYSFTCLVGWLARFFFFFFFFGFSCDAFVMISDAFGEGIR